MGIVRMLARLGSAVRSPFEHDARESGRTCPAASTRHKLPRECRVGTAPVCEGSVPAGIESVQGIAKDPAPGNSNTCAVIRSVIRDDFNLDGRGLHSACARRSTRSGSAADARAAGSAATTAIR